MRRKPRKGPRRKYDAESDLCDEFAYHARNYGFAVHAETADFDLLLVARDRCPGFMEGTQIGVQAKLHANVTVLRQALPRAMTAAAGPHYYAVLVPFADDVFSAVAHALGIGVFCATALFSRGDALRLAGWRASPHTPRKPCWVPKVEVASLSGGLKSPVRLTPWKQGAFSLCARALSRGFLTRSDFAELRVSMTRWVRSQWIVDSGEHELVKGRKVKRYVLTESTEAPHRRYPDLFAAFQREDLHAVPELPLPCRLEERAPVGAPRSSLPGLR